NLTFGFHFLSGALTSTPSIAFLSIAIILTASSGAKVLLDNISKIKLCPLYLKQLIYMINIQKF
ncbi:hypothetical protein ACTPEM_26185, partial [Clostridioides difficile]